MVDRLGAELLNVLEHLSNALESVARIFFQRPLADGIQFGGDRVMGGNFAWCGGGFVQNVGECFFDSCSAKWFLLGKNFVKYDT